MPFDPKQQNKSDVNSRSAPHGTSMQRSQKVPLSSCGVYAGASAHGHSPYGLTAMQSKLLGLMALVTLLGMSKAGAATLVGTTSNATGIDGLIVDGTTYNVTFTRGPYNTAYSSSTPTFLGNSSGATDAAAALAAALISLGVSDLTGLSSSNNQAFIPDANSGGLNAGTQVDCTSCSGSNWYTDTYGSLPDALNLTFFDFVSFTATTTPGTTPLPATLPLFGTGLGALGLLARRRKRKATALTV